MKRVLVLGYFFPPINASASKRLAGLIKYLPSHDWEPIVVTRNAAPFEASDNAFMENIDNIRVYTINLDYSEHGSRVHRKFNTLLQPCNTPKNWYNALLGMLDPIIIKERPDLILASAPPDGSLAIANVFAKKYSIPWIADFRDTAAQKYLIGNLPPSWIFYNLRKLLSSCSDIITVSDGLASIINTKFHKLATVITSGFDDSEINQNTIIRSAIFEIIYTGRIIKDHQDPSILFQAVNNLIEEHIVTPDEFKVTFYGENRFYDDTVMKYLRKYQGFARYGGNLSRMEIIQEQRKATVLLQLAHPGEVGVITGKIFEYLAARRPILSIPSDNGEIDALLAKTGAGHSCSTVDEVKSILIKWIQEWRRSGTIYISENISKIKPFAFSVNAERISCLFDRAINATK